MITIDVSGVRNHTQRLVRDLAKNGWEVVTAPEQARLQSNRQVIEFRVPNRYLRVRFNIFSVGDRGELHRRDERRIQITTTYISGLPRPADYNDLVLGYDLKNDVYVGLDARRLNFGGQKHNASSFVDPRALESTPSDKIIVRPHDSYILGLEYQAIFRPQRLSEYIFNAEAIHEGRYLGNGLFSRPFGMRSHSKNVFTISSKNVHGERLILRTPKVQMPTRNPRASKLGAYERGDWRELADVSPQELEAIRQRWSEIGDRGEYFVFQFEKQRLRKAGCMALAGKVDWVSRRAVGKGYDIGSFESDGSPRYIEVKSTNGSGMTFLMSNFEWKVATRQKESYFIYRIINVERTPELKRVVQNPVLAENQRSLERTASGWKIALR
jgi:hypothetical protein